MPDEANPAAVSSPAVSPPDAAPPMIDAASLRRAQDLGARRIGEVQQRALAARRTLAGQRHTTTSPDRTVTVTVDPAGTLLDLRLAPTAGRLPPAALAEAVLRTYRTATGEALEHTRRMLTDLLGEGSPALDAIARSIGLEEDS